MLSFSHFYCTLCRIASRYEMVRNGPKSGVRRVNDSTPLISGISFAICEALIIQKEKS
jgi:hypothetical protein